MKRCFKCGAEKPRTEFYAHKQMADGLLGKCKSCAKIDVGSNREKNSAYYNQRDRERAHKYAPGRKLWRAKNRGVVLAEKALHLAIKHGSVVRRPCEECGDVRSHGHHEDYRQPLVVKWLCQKHHRRRHAELKLLGIDVCSTAQTRKETPDAI